MRISWLSTLSARINVGFAVLIATFGVVTAVTVGNMYLLTKQIQVIPNGYLQLALISKDFVEKQKALRDYLSTEFANENTIRRAQNFLRRLLRQRARLLAEAEETLGKLRKIPPSHRREVAMVRNLVDSIKQLRKELEPRYHSLLGSQQLKLLLAKKSRTSTTTAKVLRKEFESMRRREAVVYAQAKSLSRTQGLLVTNTAYRVARMAYQVRVYTLLLGVIAVLVGLVIAFWVTVSLRPLRRLTQAARRIARGDYASRIEERGPTDVANLAHEFNTMGRAIEEREQELVRAERLAAVGKMAAMITHEIRNPLSSIGLNTELLDEELSELAADEARALCRAITTEIDRLTEITEEYLKFARLPKPKIAATDIGAAVSSLAGFEREALANRGVDIRVELDSPLSPLAVDEAQIRQALINLIRNATEALEAVGGGSVTLAVRELDSEEIELVVADNGPGIPKELANKLFDPFVSTKERGTGLGLALTHQIVHEHGGTMSVDSAPGKGTTFRVRLPTTGPARSKSR